MTCDVDIQSDAYLYFDDAFHPHINFVTDWDLSITNHISSFSRGFITVTCFRFSPHPELNIEARELMPIDY